ncbi:hypothetical protein SLNWT_2269 [Streptomyces albus]|uniref:Uncharacterized protein n=1 Tax=Streptomyces albus (strain ATCC 21838 / DSM 41398 / FERM P-419 / JCM 4703 / NBRC 107858) TaxID=1081613 RepID=A0A0B5ETS5_STRA4|nr:hypothetical protein SLNWT_2269 [Streptomyces albus]AOU76958.1 hypothetical protein SLNHY_2267 [Streptomyces albus]
MEGHAVQRPDLGMLRAAQVQDTAARREGRARSRRSHAVCASRTRPRRVVAARLP